MTSWRHIFMFVNNTFHGTTVNDKNLNAMNIKFWRRCNASFITNIPWKLCTNLNIFHRDIKENASGCFCLMFGQKKHPLAFSFISRWKMYRFIQNFQGMFVSNWAFSPGQNYIFIAAADSQILYQIFIFYRETHYFANM